MRQRRRLNFIWYQVVVIGLIFSARSPAISQTQVDAGAPPVSLRVTFEREQYAAIERRRSFVLAAMQSRYLTHKSPKFRTYDILGLTAVHGCGGGQFTNYIANVLNFDPTPRNDLQPDLFALPALVRYLNQFGDCLDDAQKQKIAQALSSNWDVYWHGTINHASLQATSAYLLAQYFPDLIWHDWGKTYTSAEVMEKFKDLLLRRYRKFMIDGEDEQFSPTYTMANFMPLLNLIDFSHDPDIRQMAEASATSMLIQMRANSFHGTFLPPLARVVAEQHNAPVDRAGFKPSTGQQILWYYFGEPNQKLLDIQNRREPVFVVMLALSKWMPRSVALRVSPAKDKSYIITTVTPTFAKWDLPTRDQMLGSAYVSDNFAIGLGVVNFDPAWYNYDTQTFGIYFKSPKVFNYIECYHPYWESNAGEDAWLTDRSSPFEEGHLSGTRGVLLFDIPDRDPWQYSESNRFFHLRSHQKDSLFKLAECRFPKKIDEAVVKSTVAFFREGDVYIGIRTLNGNNALVSNLPNDRMPEFSVIKIVKSRTAIYFRVAVAGKALDFARFQEEFMNDQVSYDKQKNSVTYRDEVNRSIEVKFALTSQPDGWVSAYPDVRIDGEALPRSHEFRIKTPFLLAGGGVFKLRTDIGSLDINFRGRIPTIKETAGAY